MPIIRPGKDNGSRDARFIASLQLPRKSFSLKTGSFPNGIDAGLRQNIVRALGIGFDLLPELPDIDAQVLCVGEVVPQFAE